MKKRVQVTCVGEVLIDLVSQTTANTLMQASSFVRVAGGAPANVAVGLARLGVSTAFVGKVGDDPFGRFAVGELAKAKVDTRGIVFDKSHKTRLAFVSVSRSGERDFEFWERNPADQELTADVVDMKRIAQSPIVNIGSFLLYREPSRSTAYRIVREVKNNGGNICFDPNIRLSLWQSSLEAKNQYLKMVRNSTILRLNENEAFFLSGRRTVEKAALKLKALGPELVVITLAGKGCYYLNNLATGYVKGFRVRPVDTTGCGDGFLAALLKGIASSGRPVGYLREEELRLICTTANAVAALTALKRGAIAAMPTKKELRRFLARKGMR